MIDPITNNIQHNHSSTTNPDKNMDGTSSQPTEETPVVQHSGSSDDGAISPPARSFHHDADDLYNKSIELEELNRIHSESDCDFDYEDTSREHELLMHDLAEDNDDFARSDDEGWYYSDED